MKLFAVAAGFVLAFAGLQVQAQTQAPRFKPLIESELTEAQKKVAGQVASGPRGRLNPDGPTALFLRSPDLASRTQAVGEYLRYNSSLPLRLNEFAFLITARQWNAQIEWLIHQPLALKAGLAREVADDLARGVRPAAMKDDEATIYQFLKELHETKNVGDATFKAMVDKFGERGVIDLIGLTGYYTMLAMVLNVAQQPLPGGAPPPLQILKP